MKTNYPNLRQLMRAYFHQDVDDLFDSNEKVWNEFAKTHTIVDCDYFVREVNTFLKNNSIDIVKKLEIEFGPTYYIGNSDAEAKDWLLRAAKTIGSFHSKNLK